MANTPVSLSSKATSDDYKMTNPPLWLIASLVGASVAALAISLIIMHFTHSIIAFLVSLVIFGGGVVALYLTVLQPAMSKANTDAIRDHLKKSGVVVDFGSKKAAPAPVSQ